MEYKFKVGETVRIKPKHNRDVVHHLAKNIDEQKGKLGKVIKRGTKLGIEVYQIDIQQPNAKYYWWFVDCLEPEAYYEPF